MMQKDMKANSYLLNSQLKVVYLVGTATCDGNSVKSIHKTYEGALNAWNSEKLRLIAGHRTMIEHGYDNDRYSEMIKNLENEDPETIDNYPHETPYIDKFTLLE